MQPVSLSLILIRAPDLAASLAFYHALGLTFVEEQHGKGPIHYSCTLGSLVLEIYPNRIDAPNTPDTTMLGFNVASLETALNALQLIGIEPKSPPKNADWGLWVNVVEPSGRIVQLIEPTQ